MMTKHRRLPSPPYPFLAFVFYSRVRRVPSSEMRGSDDQHLAPHLLLPGCLRIFNTGGGGLPLGMGGFRRPDDFRLRSPSYPVITNYIMQNATACGPMSPFPTAPLPANLPVLTPVFYPSRVGCAPSLGMSGSDAQHHRLPSPYPYCLRFFSAGEGLLPQAYP